MRIIITKKGEYIIKQLEDEKSMNDLNMHNGIKFSPRLPHISSIKIIKEKLLNTSKSFYSGAKLRTLQKKKSLKMMSEYFNRDESKINTKELDQAKKIIVSKPKVQLSQKFLEKYHNLDSSFKEKLDNLSNMLSSYKDKNITKNEEDSSINISPFNLKNNYGENFGFSKFNRTDNSFSQNRKIKIGDIISRPNLIQLKSYIIKSSKGYNDVRIPLDKNNKNSFNFRTKYANKNAVKSNLDNILNLNINSDRTDLINYLKKKKSISPYYFKNLLKKDESQIYKLNKICGKIMNNENNKSFLEMKKGKKNKNKLYDNSSKELFSYLEKTSKILNDYSQFREKQNIIRTKGFKEIMNNTKKKYWDKFHIDGLFNTKPKHEKKSESSLEENISL